MRNKAKVKATAMEMIIKINNENVVLEVIPPAGMISQETDPIEDPLTSHNDQEFDPEETQEFDPEETQEFDPEETQEFDPEETQENDEEFADATELGQPDDRKIWHNKSEKIRRAELRSSMERLKLLVPLDDSTQKYTTVNLLRKAKQLIHKLEEKEKKNVTFRDQLMKEQKYLRKRLDSLTEVKGQAHQVSTKTLISAGTASTANKYPANLPLSQPMILKRKVSEVNNSSEVIIIGDTRVTAAGIPANVPSPTSFLATVPSVNTYQIVTTTDSQQQQGLISADNFCFILDTSGLE